MKQSSQEQGFNPIELLQSAARFMPVGPVRIAMERLAGYEPEIREVDEFGMDTEFVQDIAPLMDFFYRNYFRVNLEGIENIPKTGPVILVANHAGTLPWDALVLIHALRFFHSEKRSLRPLLEDLLFHFPYIGTLMNRLGAVRACPENAERLLRNKACVLVFPEGTKGTKKLYQDRYNIQRFGRGGTIRLAISNKAPIIPIGVVGSEEIYPMFGRLSLLAQPLGIPYLPVTPTFPWLGPLGLLPLPVRWHIRIGKPITFTDFSDDDQPDRLTLTRLNEDLRSTVQKMVQKMLQEREGIFS